MLFNLGNGQQLAVPVLSFDVGEYAWTMPDFQFAGFNWSLDFNFALIPCILVPYAHYTDHDLKIVFSPGGTYYGDSEMTPTGGCLKREGGSAQYGDIEYAFTDGDFEDYPNPDDVSVCIRHVFGGIEIWVCAAPYPDYGHAGSASVYFFDQLVWSGSLSPAINNPGYIHYHNPCWTLP